LARRARWPGVVLFAGICLLTAAYFAASRLGWIDRWNRPPHEKLSTGDFPAGVAAPMGDVRAVPLRPTVIGFTPRGSSASLLVAAGGAYQAEPEVRPLVRGPEGLFKTAYSIDVRAVVYPREEDLRRALEKGAEAGGVDLALLAVDRLAQWSEGLRDAAPRTLLMVGRSRGQEALAVAGGMHELADLRGKRLGAYPHSSSWYFALWLMARSGLRLSDVKWVELGAVSDAGRALREGKVDAAVGYGADVEAAAKDRGGKVLASTADAPHLIATVLVTRGDFAARYPDAVRRVMRGLLDAASVIRKDPTPGARLLGELAPYLGDPIEAVRSAPPADLQDNLAFFGLAGAAPVTYDELFDKAGELFKKIGRAKAVLDSEETRELGPLRYVAEAKGH
jgi:ABC-type nitrate/sulfonate/bicarbonate transport system substrate-binding protein